MRTYAGSMFEFRINPVEPGPAARRRSWGCVWSGRCREPAWCRNATGGYFRGLLMQLRWWPATQGMNRRQDTSMPN